MHASACPEVWLLYQRQCLYVQHAAKAQYQARLRKWYDVLPIYP